MMRTPLSKKEFAVHLFIPFSFALYLSIFASGQELLLADSSSYIYFSELRSLAYPLFLNTVSFISSDLISIAYAQVWLFALSVFFLSLALRKIGSNNWFGLFVSLSLCLNPYSLDLHFQILPHSFLISLNLLMFSCLIYSFAKARLRTLFGFGFFIGLIISTTPMGWAYLSLILFSSLLIAQQNKASRLKTFFIPLCATLLIVTFENTTYSTLHPYAETSPLPAQLFSKASLMEANEPSPYAEKDPRTTIWHMIENDLTAVRIIIWDAPNFATRNDFLMRYEAFLATSFAQDTINSASEILEKSKDDIRMDIASSRIIQNPGAFLSIAFEHYRSLWTMHAISHPNDVQQVNDYRKKNSPYPLINQDSLPQEANSIAAIQQPVLYGFWLLSFLTLLFGLFAMSNRVPFSALFSTSFICALLVHAQTSWIALTTVGTAEAMLTLSPLLIIGSVCLVLSFYCAFFSPIRTDR